MTAEKLWLDETAERVLREWVEGRTPGPSTTPMKNLARSLARKLVECIEKDSLLLPARRQCSLADARAWLGHLLGDFEQEG